MARRAGLPKRALLVERFVNDLLDPEGTLFLGVFTIVIAPETSITMTGLLVVCMTFVSASFRIVYVDTLDRPFVGSFLEASQCSVNRVFGVLLVGLGLCVATMERQPRRARGIQAAFWHHARVWT